LQFNLRRGFAAAKPQIPIEPVLSSLRLITRGDGVLARRLPANGSGENPCD
jgi:hypothetical protein